MPHQAYQVQQLLSNSAVLASCMVLVFLFVRALFTTVQDYGFAKWYHTFEGKTAIALGGIFLVGGLSRAFATTLLQLRSWGYSTDWLEAFPIPIVTGALFVMFTACLIRIFSRNNREWVLAVGFIILFCAVMYLIHGEDRAVL